MGKRGGRESRERHQELRKRRGGPRWPQEAWEAPTALPYSGCQQLANSTGRGDPPFNLVVAVIGPP